MLCWNTSSSDRNTAASVSSFSFDSSAKTSVLDTPLGLPGKTPIILCRSNKSGQVKLSFSLILRSWSFSVRELSIRVHFESTEDGVWAGSSLLCFEFGLGCSAFFKHLVSALRSVPLSNVCTRSLLGLVLEWTSKRLNPPLSAGRHACCCCQVWCWWRMPSRRWVFLPVVTLWASKSSRSRVLTLTWQVCSFF